MLLMHRLWKPLNRISISDLIVSVSIPYSSTDRTLARYTSLLVLTASRCVRTFVCAFVSVFVSVCVCLSVCLSGRVCACVSVCARLFAYVRVYVRACVCACVYVRA